MSGREDYAERREARIDHLNGLSEAAMAKSNDAFKKSHDLIKDIPLGQPNIIGHSELPNLRKKSINAMEKSIEAAKTSEYYADKADAAESNTAISSDDPEAIEKLIAKIERLEAEKERIKAKNKEARKTGGEQSPWYTLPYLNRDIKAAKDRIEKLRRVDSMPEQTIKFEGGCIEVDNSVNRVIIRHDEKSDNETISMLKTYGFHWSKSESAWMRLKSPEALRIAKNIVEHHCNINER